MIKFIGAAIWICLATIGAVFFSFQASSAKPAKDGEAPAALMGGLDYIKTEVISVPLIRDSAINGYFLTRLVYTVEPEKLKTLSVPAESLIIDEVYSYIYAHPQIDFSKAPTIDLDGFRNGVRDSINARVKDTLVSEVLIEQFDYLSKDEIRDNSMRRKSTKKSDEPAAEATGHGAPAAH